MSDDIDKLAEAILASKKNSNSIIDLLKHAGSVILLIFDNSVLSFGLFSSRARVNKRLDRLEH